MNTDRLTSILGFIAAVTGLAAGVFPEANFIAGPLSAVFTGLLGYYTNKK